MNVQQTIIISISLMLILVSSAVFSQDNAQSNVQTNKDVTETKVVTEKPTTTEKAHEKVNPKFYNEDNVNIAVTSQQPTFVIKLKSNPTTGYAWFIREYDSNLITPNKRMYQRPDTKLVGAPGFEVWTFKVKPSGFLVPQQTILRMIYARPWQGSDNATQVVFRVSTMKTSPSK